MAIRWVLSGVAAFVILAGSMWALVLALPFRTEPGRGPPGPSRNPSSTSPIVEFVPPAVREGGRVRMPLTFPDGTTAEVLYPVELDLAGFGLAPYSSGSIPGFGRDFWIFHGRADQVLRWFGDPQLLAEYPDGEGEMVGFWHLPADPSTDHLAFQFGRWTVLVYDYKDEAAGRMSDGDRALWASHLLGRETRDGFLVLTAEPPLNLAGAGDHAGPSLGFEQHGRMLQLIPGRCAAYREGKGGFDKIQMVGDLAVDRSKDFAAWCVPEASMTVHVSQKPDDAFIDLVLEGLIVQNVNLAS